MVPEIKPIKNHLKPVLKLIPTGTDFCIDKESLLV